MIEVFRPIKGFENLYEISNRGRVKSLANSGRRKEKMLKPYTNGYYFRVSLSKNGRHRRFKIHRLVVMAFIPNLENHPEVNHKDSNKLNNMVDNLEWCTRRYNRNHYLKTQNFSSAYPGVGWYRRTNKWRVRIFIRGKRIHVGYFTDELKAAEAYQKESQKLYNSKAVGD